MIGVAKPTNQPTKQTSCTVVWVCFEEWMDTPVTFSTILACARSEHVGVWGVNTFWPVLQIISDSLTAQFTMYFNHVLLSERHRPIVWFMKCQSCDKRTAIWHFSSDNARWCSGNHFCVSHDVSLYQGNTFLGMWNCAAPHSGRTATWKFWKAPKIVQIMKSPKMHKEKSRFSPSSLSTSSYIAPF